MNKTLLVLMSSAFLAMSACEREGPAERAGKEIDSAGKQLGEKVERAGEQVQDAAKDARK